MPIVTFERTTGHPVDVHATYDELQPVAIELTERGRRDIAERLPATDGDTPSLTIVVGDHDRSPVLAAIEAAAESHGLGDHWARVREL